MVRKYYKVKLMMIDTNQTDNEFKNNDMLDILLNANLKEVEDIIVYRTVLGDFKELITNKRIPAIVEELLPYSNNEHSYDLIYHKPVFFFCNTSIEKDTTRTYASLDELEATKDDISKYLNKHINKNGTKEVKAANILSREKYLKRVFEEAKNNYNNILEENNISRQMVKFKDRKIIKNLIDSYNI